MMQRRHLFSLAAAPALATLPLAGVQAAAATATVGQAAPGFALRDTGGRTVNLADFRRKYVVLEWTNPGCPFVRKHYGSGNMPATQKDATGRGVVWLSVNSTEKDSGDYLEPARLADWMRQQRAAQSAVLMDEEGTTGRSYGARTTPHLYIVDPRGVLVYAGGIDSIASADPADIPKAVNYVRQSLGEALAGRPISAATTRPYGCSIKYKA